MSEPKVKSKREFAIRVVCPHGKAKLLMGADEDDIRNSLPDIGELLVLGCNVERVTVETARKTPFGCSKCVPGERENAES